MLNRDTPIKDHKKTTSNQYTDTFLKSMLKDSKKQNKKKKLSSVKVKNEGIQADF